MPLLTPFDGPILNFKWRNPTDFYPECPFPDPRTIPEKGPTDAAR